MKKWKVGVIGATGYAGLELCRLLLWNDALSGHHCVRQNPAQHVPVISDL